ncbi:hypothetical protein DITRI_Ditri07aG0151800 [Diplodiscus trichospermus]
MVSKSSAPIAFLLALNLLFFTLVSSQPPPPPPPTTCRLVSLGVCANLLGLVALNITLPTNPGSPCCRVINGLGSTGVQVSACLCRSLTANIVGAIRLNVTAGATALLDSCGKQVAIGFTCPS